MNDSVSQCRFLLSRVEIALTGLDDSHRALEPQPGTKTAGWLIGHLAVTGDFARRLCGRKPICPAEWRVLFNPGSQPSHDPAIYPSISALCDAFRAVYADLCDAAPHADPGLLAALNPYAPARDDFPTAGSFVGYLLTGHLAYHLGQLVGWRGAAGFGRLTGSGTLAA
jgi:hypothetical protein